MVNTELKDIWKKTLAQLEIKIDSPVHYKTWFTPTELIEINGKKARVGVKNSYTRDWLRKKHITLINKTISHVARKDLEVELEISETLINEPYQKISKKEIAQESLLSVKKGTNQQFEDILIQSNFSPEFSFSNFIVGPSNRLAHAAAIGVAETPGTLYNPLFLYGGTGLGKTHLAQAIVQKIFEKKRGTKAFYTTSENFLNEMVSSIKTGKTHEFRNKYRFMDVLIIDDIQVISKWEQTQDELFNTFNALHGKKKQIILVSDRPPEKIHNLESRLKSRFQGGMVIQIERPDFETRLAIVESKSKTLGIHLSQEILGYIAENITDNIRQLEGALKQIGLYNQMHTESLTLDEVGSILQTDPKNKRKSISPKHIIKAVAKEFEVSTKDILSKTRKAEIAFARQVIMYILREEFGYKLEEIAMLLNRNDHTTVIHAVDKIKSMIALEPGLSEQIEEIKISYSNKD